MNWDLLLSAATLMSNSALGLEHLPPHPPRPHSACSESSTETVTQRSTWVKYAEFFWLTHGRISFSSHSRWTQIVVDVPVLLPGLLSLPSCMPRTWVILAALDLWLPHPAPYCMKVPNLHALAWGPNVASDSKVSKDTCSYSWWGQTMERTRRVMSWQLSANLPCH